MQRLFPLTLDEGDAPLAAVGCGLRIADKCTRSEEPWIRHAERIDGNECYAFGRLPKLSRPLPRRRDVLLNGSHSSHSARCVCHLEDIFCLKVLVLFACDCNLDLMKGPQGLK